MQTSPPGEKSSEAVSKASRRTLILFSLLASLTVAVGLAEVSLRLFCSQAFELVQDERNLLYRYDEVLGWFPIANSSNQFLGTRRITAVHNSQGFRGGEYAMSNKPRLLFLGDSFVWGYDVEAPERFTDKLQSKHPEWTVYNFGVSGYGTDQEYILLQKRFDWYQPQVVFLMFSTETDDADNSTNCRWGYYKPYCTINSGRLELHGTPVPRSEKVFLATHKTLASSYVVRLLARGYFAAVAPRVLTIEPDPTGAIIRDLQRFVTLKGGVLVVGLTRSNPQLQQFLEYFKIPYVDVSTPLRYIGMGEHWTPEGNSFVAEKIDEFLVKGKYMEPRSTAPTAGSQATPGTSGGTTATSTEPHPGHGTNQ